MNKNIWRIALLFLAAVLAGAFVASGFDPWSNSWTFEAAWSGFTGLIGGAGSFWGLLVLIVAIGVVTFWAGKLFSTGRHDAGYILVAASLIIAVLVSTTWLSMPGMMGWATLILVAIIAVLTWVDVKFTRN